jgi:hypothetical protein
MLRFENLESRRLAAADLAAGIDPGALDSAGSKSEQLSMTTLPFVGQVCFPAEAPRIVFEQAVGEVAHLDVDQDGFITYNDVEAVLRRLRGEEPIGPLLPAERESHDGVERFDANRDGVLTPLDALTILNRIHFYNPLVPCNCGQCLANAVVDGVP